MEREFKFRYYDPSIKAMLTPACVGEFGFYAEDRDFEDGKSLPFDRLMQYTGLKDKNGTPIFEGDILEFADKWEWYKGSYGIKMTFADPDRKKELQKQYDAEPMERRVIEIPNSYEWLLSSEIQTYWQVIGNIYSNPELINKATS